MATVASSAPTAKVRELNDTILFCAIHVLSTYNWGNTCYKYDVVL